jgi:ribosomal protein S18 acetylase RimI-like enzyme
MSVKARRASPADWEAIEMLCQRVRRKLPRLWWWEEHLGDDLFMVIDRDGIVAGALLAWPDGAPVAWVRLAALDDDIDAEKALSLMLPPVSDRLRARGVENLAWMDYFSWAGDHLRAYGFVPLADVITLAKLDRAIPETNAQGITLRPVSDADIPAVIGVDRAAFAPHWWQGETTMLRRRAAASHFVVGEAMEGVVGYIEGDSQVTLAHINRIAVHPRYQGRGVGALLLQDALDGFWRLGAGRVTLNTQSDNDSSQRLYRRFGFKPTGDVVIAWELEL